jgi:CheY-like chemotaxis protein
MVAHPGLVRLVLADMAMPRMDGGELAERIRDRQSPPASRNFGLPR